MAFTTDTYVIKGMRQDDSDLLFNGNKEGLSFAFENLNMRFSVDTETTSLVATQEKGNSKCKLFITKSFFVDNTNNINFVEITSLPFAVVGYCVLDKYLALFGKCTTNTTIGQGETQIVFNKENDIIIRFELKENDLYGWLIYNDNDLNFNLQYPLETIGNVETNLVKKIYFVDGINVPRCVNLVSATAGMLSNINLGFALELKDVLSVSKEYNSLPGNFPMGKIRFFYTYFNDLQSESNIVDWSPFFDCNYTNQGGSESSTYKTQFAFRVNIENVDHQFKFIRIYFQHFTKNNANEYNLKYVERPLDQNLNSFSTVITFDGTDVKDSTTTYLDHKLSNYTFIPYTFAEKNNRMFYGNIKRSIPSIKDIDFSGKADIAFYDKLIGYEDLTRNAVYQYTSDTTTFFGSNFDYMGFRKHNWYRFGLIAQYYTGEWSDVIFICDKQCDRSSHTEIEYNKLSFQVTPINSAIDVSTKPKANQPIRSNYYIPSAKLIVKSAFKTEIQKLAQLGFRRIKPVCVVPTYECRDVLTQGISCSTVYVGGKRRTLKTTGNGLFAMPSWFFRPLPLFQIDKTINKPSYPYTIRDITDQFDHYNVKTVDGWILNPTFDNDSHIRYNSMYREFRHGYSLPPKDRINAELQSSDFSIHDYFYLENGGVSLLFSSEDPLDLFDFASNKEYYKTKCYLKPHGDVDSIDITKDNWYEKLAEVYDVVPHHSLYTTGYDNTVFIDESFCTLNSPDIDYNFKEQVEPWFKDQNIAVVGYAQVTNSMSSIDIDSVKFEQDNEESDMLDKDSLYTVTGECMFNLIRKENNQLDNATEQYIKNLAAKPYLQNNPMSVFSGPWWLDTMLVNCFKHRQYPYNDNNRFIVSANYSEPQSLAPDSTSWNITNDNLYNLSSSDITLDATKYGRFFSRGINLNNKIFHWTTSFYGETNKLINKDSVSNKSNSPYPYVENKKFPVIFSDFLDSPTFPALNPTNNSPEDLNAKLYDWAKYSLTWNTVKSTADESDDTYWNEFFNNRQRLSTPKPPINAGTQILPNEGIPNLINTIGDVVNSIYNGDFRNTYSYYFFPYYANNTQSAFYTKNMGNEAKRTDKIHVVHPWLLPQERDFLTRHHDSIQWLIESIIIGLNQLSKYSDFENYDELLHYYNLGSIYGCHYYTPFSTNFEGSYFEPYYAHVIYPFMSTEKVPFCGSSQAYRCTEKNNRPKYNATHSCLYSNCTNYFNTDEEFTFNTYSAYYHSPKLTQEIYAEPDLTSIPFVKAEHGAISYLYSYLCNDTPADNDVLLRHHTQTLTAAMKWYRGFRSLKSQGDESQLIDTGVYLNKPNIAGNLLFSGYLPQFCTKSGLLQTNDTKDNLNYRTVMEDPERIEDYKNFFDQGGPQVVELSFLSTPHVVYYNQTDDKMVLLDKFYAKQPTINILNTNYETFTPQFYYKEFINEPIPYQTTTDSVSSLPYNVKNVGNWYYSTYPHTGHFEQFDFNDLHKSSQPYWNNTSAVFSQYPTKILEKQHWINILDEDKLIVRDSNSDERNESNYWLLPISNMYNTSLIASYTATEDKNPYTYQNVSVEQWNWKMCGETINLDNWLNSTSINKQQQVKYLEGDTYFQRYNCFKTVSKDTTFSTLWEQQTSDVATQFGENDVTETASVMIESYYNIDGIYWDHNILTDTNQSPLIQPYYNNQHQINPVYSIQNDICDVFKQIDTNYQSSQLDHYPTMIMWSAQKQDGEMIDSWGIVPITNKMLTSGEMGAINKLISYKDNIYCLQEHGLSVLNYNSKVIEPTDTNSTLSLYLSDATRLQDVTYLSRNIGTLNKWSVALGQYGFYWIDETLQNFYKCGESENGFGIENMSNKYGFKSWSKAHISSDNYLWNINTFTNNLRAFKANYDLKNNDVYWANNEFCICFNETLDCFTSFYNYENIPYKFNYLDKCYSIYPKSKHSSEIWEDYSKYSHSLYGANADSYIELLVNPSGQYDKVFNFIEYYTEVYDPSNKYDVAYASINPYNYIRVNNTYQIGDSLFNNINTQHKFKLWRTSIPREIKNGKQTMNRIRSPWCKIKLQHKADKPIMRNTLPSKEYRDKLHYINVNYTIPEQPIKTNIRN